MGDRNSPYFQGDPDREAAIRELGSFVAGPLAAACLGEYLGGGVSRKVFVWRPDPDLVVKIEANDPDGEAPCYFQNVMEFRAWDALGDRPWGLRYLVPCVRISPDGHYLWQRRGYQPSSQEWVDHGGDYPEFPDAGVFLDAHMDNWMMHGGKMKLIDYGFVQPFHQLANWTEPEMPSPKASTSPADDWGFKRKPLKRRKAEPDAGT